MFVSILGHLCIIFGKGSLNNIKKEYCYRTKSSTAYTGVEESPDKAKSSGKVGSIP